jgi:type I restriction enzyme, S subunit
MTQITHIPLWYKSSPLGIIPSDWEIRNFYEIFEFKNGLNASKEDYGEGIRFINVMEVIYNSYIKASIVPWLVKITDAQAKLYLVEKWDVLFNRTSETTEEIWLSSVYLDDEPVVFWGFVIRWKLKNKGIFNDDYKKYCFRAQVIRDQIIVNGQGVVRSNIWQENLWKILIPVPSIKEQYAIASLLSTWDEAISKISKLIWENEKRKISLMQELLTWKRRLSWFHTEIGLHPVWKYLKEVSERCSDTKWIKVLSVTNSRGFIDQEDQFDRSVASQNTSNYKIVRKWQFAYNPSRVNVGSLDLLSNFESGILSPMYVVFETDERFLLSKYFYYQLKSHWFSWHIPMYVQGSVRDSLSFDWLCGMKFFIPSTEEQSRIVDIFEKSDQEIQLLKTKLEKLKEQKKWLMQQLLTGKKRLKF